MKSFDKRMGTGFKEGIGPLFLAVWVVLVLLFAARTHAASVTTGTERFILDNGLTVILKRDASAPVASIQVWVKTGSANETEEEAGITHLIEHMIFKGTPSRPTGEIARAIEAAGGHINAYTSLDRTVYYVEVPSAQLDTGLDVLLDAVQHAVFDAGELEREKEVVLEEYRRSLDIPERRLGWDMMALSYEKHPYRRPIIGYEKTIRSLDRKAVLAYLDKWYTPRNMVLVAVGDFHPKEALERIKTLVRDFPPRAGKAPARPAEPPQTGLRKIVRKAAVQQVYLNLAWHIPELTHQDIYALDLLETILGRGKSSSLYARLKMEANLVTRIEAGVYALEDPGLFSIEATLGPDRLDRALEAIGQEISRIRSAPVAEAELARAKTIGEADFVFDMENMAGQARTLAFFQTMTGDMYHADRYLDRLKGVTTDDILRVARVYLGPENLSIGVMAPEGTEIRLDERAAAALFAPSDSASQPKTASRPTGEAQPIKAVLPSGMRLIVKTNHRIPGVSMTAGYLGGTRLEPEGKWGISRFVAEMLTRGTHSRSAAQIAATVETCAGTLDGFSGRNSLGVSARFLAKDIHAGMELLADVLLNPEFPETEMEKVREDILAGIKAKKDRPTQELFDLFYRTLYPHHPYGHPQTGSEETIRSITREDLKTWYASIASPGNLVLTVVGDVDAERLIPYVKTLFSAFSPSGDKFPDVAPEPPLKDPRVARIIRPLAQTHLIVGYLGPGIESPLNAPMALIETSLAGQGGRLFSRLRDEQSLAYAVTAFRSPGLGTGAFGAYIACDPAKVEAATQGIFQELDRIRKKGLTKQELEEAKRYLVGNLQIGLQTNSSQAMQMTLDELYGMGYNHLPAYIRQIEAVTPEAIGHAAREVLLPDKYVLVTVGPADGQAGAPVREQENVHEGRGD